MIGARFAHQLGTLGSLPYIGPCAFSHFPQDLITLGAGLSVINVCSSLALNISQTTTNYS